MFSFAACTQQPEQPQSEQPQSEQPLPEQPQAEQPLPEADTSWSRIEERGYFILGLDDNFPPMGFRDEKYEIVGFDIDMARAAAAYLGVEVQLKPVVWSTATQKLIEGEIDCIWNGMSVTAERLLEIDFSEPYVNSDQIVVVRADSNIATFDDLAGKIIGTQDASSSLKALDEFEALRDSFAELRKFDTFTAAMMDLESGRIDAVVIDGIAFYGDFNVNSPGAYKVLAETFLSEEMAIGVRQEDNAWTDMLNEAMNALKADGTAAEISIKWFGENIVI